jgi:hypothetical protein
MPRPTSRAAATISGAMAPVATAEFSCRPWAEITIDAEDTADVLDRLLGGLERDDRAIAPVVSYADDCLDAVFQVKTISEVTAEIVGRDVFQRALRGIPGASTAGVDVAAGGPENLPGD